MRTPEIDTTVRVVVEFDTTDPQGTVDSVAAAVAQLNPSPSAVYAYDPPSRNTRDWSGRTPDDYQQFDQSDGPVIGATAVADIAAGDVVAVDLDRAQVAHHGWYVPHEHEDPTGERFEAVASELLSRGALVENVTSAPGAEPETVIVLPNGDHAGPGDWVVRNRGSETLEARPGGLPLPPQRVLTPELHAWLVKVAEREVKPTDTTRDIVDRVLWVLQREGVARPFSTDDILLSTEGLGAIGDDGRFDLTVSPPHWYASLMARIFGDMLAEHPGANYVELPWPAHPAASSQANAPTRSSSATRTGRPPTSYADAPKPPSRNSQRLATNSLSTSTSPNSWPTG